MEKEITAADLAASGFFTILSDEDETFMYYTGDDGYKIINAYLLGDSDDAAFLKKYTNEDLMDAQKYIKNLDQLFQNKAKINRDPHFVVYRGMDKPYEPMESPSSRKPILLKNFVSTTPDAPMAKVFMNHATRCCMFRFHVDVGVRYINVNDHYSEEAEENEILFPRGLFITYMGESEEDIEDHDSGDIDTVKIYDYKLTQGPAPAPAPASVQTTQSVEKLKRCPNGTTRNKKTGLCQPTKSRSIKPTKSRSIKPTKSRSIKPTKSRSIKPTKSRSIKVGGGKRRQTTPRRTKRRKHAGKRSA
jgi:hypothetical protein